MHIDHRQHDLHEHSTQPTDGPLEFTRDQDTVDRIAAALTLQRWHREVDRRRREKLGEGKV